MNNTYLIYFKFFCKHKADWTDSAVSAAYMATNIMLKKLAATVGISNIALSKNGCKTLICTTENSPHPKEQNGQTYPFKLKRFLL